MSNKGTSVISSIRKTISDKGRQYADQLARSRNLRRYNRGSFDMDPHPVQEDSNFSKEKKKEVRCGGFPQIIMWFFSFVLLFATVLVPLSAIIISYFAVNEVYGKKKQTVGEVFDELLKNGSIIFAIVVVTVYFTSFLIVLILRISRKCSPPGFIRTIARKISGNIFKFLIESVTTIPEGNIFGIIVLILFIAWLVFLGLAIGFSVKRDKSKRDIDIITVSWSAVGIVPLFVILLYLTVFILFRPIKNLNKKEDFDNLEDLI